MSSTAIGLPGSLPGRLGQRLADAVLARSTPAASRPQAVDPLQAIVERCKTRVTKKAMLAAGAAVVPIPGLDIAADLALLTRLLHEINAEFGLSEAQVASLPSAKRMATFKAVGWVGNQLIGKVVTHALVLHVLKSVGIRMTAKQVTKYVPIAGQALSAALAFTAMRHVCTQHINDCVRVRKALVVEAI